MSTGTSSRSPPRDCRRLWEQPNRSAEMARISAMDRSTRPMDDAKGPPRPGSGRPALAGPPQLLTGGMVAYNEEANIGPALRSLLEQELPDGVAWDAIWVVAS